MRFFKSLNKCLFWNRDTSELYLTNQQFLLYLNPASNVKIFCIMDKELRQFSLSSKTVNEQKTSKLTWCSGTHKYSVILLTSTSLGCSRRKVLEVYLISSTKETKQAHQIQSIMLQASWHSKFLHICFKSFKFLLLKTKCSLSHPERELSNIRCEEHM